MADFTNRVYGCALVKAINSNYNADFAGQPRTLPNGQVYATDKTYKYAIRNFIKDVYGESVFFYKTFNNEMKPMSLNEKYLDLFGAFPKKAVEKKAGKGKKAKDESNEEGVTNTSEEYNKPEIASNLLTCIDIRMFGATFAGETNISVHGPVQVNHAVNLWENSQIYSEQISSPFRNEGQDGDKEKDMTTLGRQSRLDEGHYLHHFSINPSNLRDILKVAGKGAMRLTEQDIDKLKDGMMHGVTWYDSASKAGCENEMLVWVELVEGSKLVLPNFTNLITLEQEKVDGKYIYDFQKLTNKLGQHKDQVLRVEISYNEVTCLLKNCPDNSVINNL